MRPRRVAASLLSGTLALTLMGVSPGLPAPAGAAPVPESDAFVRRVSFDLLNDADPTRATLDAQIAAVGSSNGGVFAAELQRTEAGRGAIVEDAYEDVLRRDADPAGRDFFVESLGAGLTSMRLTATFLGSGEYYAKRGGGTDSGFVDCALPRRPGPGRRPRRQGLLPRPAGPGADPLLGGRLLRHERRGPDRAGAGPLLGPAAPRRRRRRRDLLRRAGAPGRDPGADRHLPRVLARVPEQGPGRPGRRGDHRPHRRQRAGVHLHR